MFSNILVLSFYFKCSSYLSYLTNGNIKLQKLSSVDYERVVEVKVRHLYTTTSLCWGDESLDECDVSTYVSDGDSTVTRVPRLGRD